MTDVMPANPDNSPVSSELQEVFYLPYRVAVPENIQHRAFIRRSI